MLSKFHKHQSLGHQVVPAQAADFSFFGGLFIEPAELIDERSAGVTALGVSRDGFLDFYLHTPGGSVNVSGGSLGGQVIESLPIPLPDQTFVRSVISSLDASIDLDFREVAVASAADVDLYYDSNIDVGDSDSGVTFGMAVTSGRDWELFVNYPPLQNDHAYRRYVFLHEFGHSLGLEHAFDSSDGDVAKGITDPWKSNYPEETVMAYRSPLHGIWPAFFTVNDLNALVEIWGAEQQILSDLGEFRNGADFSESFRGGAGPDDIRSKKGNDTLRGGLGDDILFAGAGNDWMNGNAGDDLIRGGSGDDVLHGGAGNDVLWGDKGSDFFHLSAGFDLIRDFDSLSGDRVVISPDTQFSIKSIGDDLEVISNFGVLRLGNVVSFADPMDFIIRQI